MITRMINVMFNYQIQFDIILAWEETFSFSECDNFVIHIDILTFDQKVSPFTLLGV